MRKILLIIFLLLFSISSNAAAPSLKDFTINKDNTIYAKRNMSYFINQGYELVLQETRGIRTAYVLKKGKDPDAAHKNFDAVMVKDNFNIQLLCDLIERLTL